MSTHRSHYLLSVLAGMGAGLLLSVIVRVRLSPHRVLGLVLAFTGRSPSAAGDVALPTTPPAAPDSTARRGRRPEWRRRHQTI